MSLNCRQEEKREEKNENRQIDVGKEAAIEAEVKAARERAVIPLDIRMKQFRDMLAEKEVQKTECVRNNLRKNKLKLFDMVYCAIDFGTGHL